MCGRFTLSATLTTLTETFPEFELSDQPIPRYNITPTQDVAVVANNNPVKIEFFRWGLIPIRVQALAMSHLGRRLF